MENFYLLLFWVVILFLGGLLLNPWFKRFRRSSKFDQKDFEKALCDGRVEIIIEDNNRSTVSASRATSCQRINYAKFSQQQKWAEAERIVAEMKDAKEALRFYNKLERLYESSSDSEHMDAKIDIYKMVVYNKMHERFSSYVPLSELSESIDLPMPVFEKIGEVLNENEHKDLITEYPEAENAFADFGEDTEVEDILTSQADEALKAKSIEIKRIYDSDMAQNEKIQAIDKILKSSQRLRWAFEDLTAKELLDVAA